MTGTSAPSANPLAYPVARLSVGGRALAGVGVSAVVNPATGEKIGETPLIDDAGLDLALQAVLRGQAQWAGRNARERADVLIGAAQHLRTSMDRIATTLVLEEGKPLAEARREVVQAADTLQWCAEEAVRSYGRIVPGRSAGGLRAVLREPVGPVAAFTPWNMPLLTPARKVGAALAAGCALILKPAEETPGSATHLADALYDAGLPPDAFSIVFGDPDRISRRLLGAAAIRKVSFTGSTAVGKHLMGLGAATLKRFTLELGGHAPVIVTEDCDLEDAVAKAVRAKLRNAGQVCTSPSRFIVQRRVADRFADELAEAFRHIVVGHGLSPATEMGPLANARRLAATTELVRASRTAGAQVLTGGEASQVGGFFYAPTVLSKVPAEAPVMRLEPFCPVAPIVEFTTDAEALAIANALPFGLAAYLFCADGRRARSLAAGLEAGLVGVNTYDVSAPETPFGGVKDSGFGSEGGSEALEAYQVLKLVNFD
jgi:succinate-semialdehyde dehydrogenase / glutarate-semialdehyde dehydrogenase